MAEKSSSTPLPCADCGKPVPSRSLRAGAVRCATCRVARAPDTFVVYRGDAESWKKPTNGNGTESRLQRIARESQRLQMREELAERLAEAGLTLDHVETCPRCGKADHVEDFCKPAEKYVEQDQVAQHDLAVEDPAAIDATWRHRERGYRVPSGTPNDMSERRGAPGHQGTGSGLGNLTALREEARIQKVVDQHQRERAEQRAREERRSAWMTADRGDSTDRQQEAHYLVRIEGLSQREAARKMDVDEKMVRKHLTGFDKATK